MANIFVNATQARANSRNNVVIHGEIKTIESEVFANIDSGVLYANVVSSSTMTNSNVYYYVWNGTTTDPTKLDQINYVKKYFTLTNSFSSYLHLFPLQKKSFLSLEK